MRPNFFHHLHPPTIPEEQSRWRYTLGAGGTAVFLLLVVILTGVLEMFYYLPAPDEAALSVQMITWLVPFGWLIRGLHFWAAQGLLAVALVHWLRVILTGAFVPPRRGNYWIGMVLFLLIVFLDFTGYILRWDAGIQWALVVGTNLLKTIPAVGQALYAFVVGASRPDGTTLLRFYAWHVFGLTVLAFFLTGWHIFRVRRDGGIAVPPPSRRPHNRRIPRGELVRREVIGMFLTGAILVLLTIFFPAPLAPPIETASVMAESARAPWFFLWIQEMLKWGAPFFWGVLLPVLLFVFLALFPWIYRRIQPGELGRWLPPSGRGAQVAALLLLIFLFVLTLMALLTTHG